MPLQVVNGAVTGCTFAIGEGVLTVLPDKMANCLEGGAPKANIMDFIPMVNIMPIGACQTPSNPQVAAATAAAQGVLTPQPCIPVVTSPWTPGAAKTMVGPAPALHQACTNTCMWGGVISITEAGQATVDVN